MYFVSDLYFYPVKSCAGIQLRVAQVDMRGIKHDRQWMIVDQAGRCLTQRDIPRMALIKPTVTEEGGLVLNAPQMSEIDVPRQKNHKPIKVTVWGDVCEANDHGDTIAKWLSQFLMRDCRLVCMSDQCIREVDRKYSQRPGDQVAFTDGFPFLLVSQASFVDLNNRLLEKLPMNRFRPNIVIDGCNPFDEDKWQRVQIGDLVFDVVKPCSRCIITSVNQETATTGGEPLKTLATYRRTNGKIDFGQNLIHVGPGQIAVGDIMKVL